MATHLAYGGAERVLSELSLRLPGHIEQVLVLFQNSITYPHRARLICLESESASLAFYGRAFRLVERASRLRRVIETERPDCVVGFLDEANFLVAMLARRAILTVHAGLSRKARSLARRLLEAVVPLVFRRAWIVAVSEGCRGELVEKYRLPSERVLTINNPIDVEGIRRAAADGVGAHDETCTVPRIVCAGRLSPEKGQAHLIRVFAALRAKLACRLMLIGSGECEQELRRLSADLGVEEGIAFLGWRPNPHPYVACGAVFVLPSHLEGFGNVLLEAMACGVPVVASDCRYGPREILAPGSDRRRTTGSVEFAEFGVLVTPCDERKRCWQDETLTTHEHALLSAIETLLRDHVLRAEYTRRGAQRAGDFDPEKIVNQYVRLMKQVASDDVWVTG